MVVVLAVMVDLVAAVLQTHKLLDNQVVLEVTQVVLELETLMHKL